MLDSLENLYFIAREDGEANIALVIEEREYEEVTEELIGIVTEQGENAGFAAQL